jgi:hypothetical protein
MNVLICDISDLKISEAHTLKNSSIPLLANIPDYVKQPAAARALGLLVGAGNHVLRPVV